MTSLELLNKVASELDDEKSPYLWTDQNLIDYAQKVRNRMCEECKFLMDNATDDICKITLVADTGLYTLSPKIIEIQAVYPSWSALPLNKYGLEMFQNRYEWKTVAGTPRGYFLDYQADKIFLWPVAETADAGEYITMTVIRYPINDLTTAGLTTSQALEIPERYQFDMIEGIKAEAYLKHDTETYNEKLSAYHQARFDKRVNEIARKYLNKISPARTASPLKAFI